MEIKYTDAQIDAMNADGPLIVYAAAGSGKTAVLTQRVKRIVCDEKNPVDADKILVVTFTKAAAAEMKGRIIEAINKEVEERERQGTATEFLLRQQMLISAANICTIDSFCSAILKENFEKAGIDPDFKFADDAKIYDVSRSVINDMVTERILSGNPDFKLVADAVGIDASLSGFCKIITKIYDKSRSLPTPEKWLKDKAALYGENGNIEYWLDKVFAVAAEELESFGAAVDTYLYEVDPINLSYTEAVSGEVANFTERFSVAISQKDYDAAKQTVDSAVINVIDGKIKKVDNELYNHLRRLREELLDRIKKLKKLFEYTLEENVRLMKLEKRAALSLVDFVIEYGNRFRAEMLSRRFMTFDMVAHTAFSLVCDLDEEGNAHPTELGRSMTQRYKAVLVDEYQDNNSLQDAIFGAVSDDGKNLFMVGDAKQSIYGFRNANPENFIRYRDESPLYNKEMTEQMSKVVLDANFRSREGICDFANFLFGSIMRKDPCGMDYTEDDFMKAESKYSETDEPAVELHIVERDKSDDSKETGASHIADYIKETMARPAFLKNKDEKDLRRAKYSDFAILMRSTVEKGRVYANLLKKAGIPVDFDLGGMFETTEIMSLVSLLKAIDNPNDDVAILATLSGPVFAVDLDRIADLRASYRADTFYGTLILACKNGEPDVVRVFEKLTELRRKAATKPVAEFIEELVEEFSLREIVSSYGEGARRRENIDTFLSIAADFESDSHCGLSAFLRRIEGYAETKKEKEGKKESADAVKLMTVHGSKGLEFPICILAETSSEFNDKDINSTVQMVEEGISINLSDLRTHKKSEPLSTKIIKRAMRQSLIAEEERLLYVAVTRAKEKLVVIIDGAVHKDEVIRKSMLDITHEERKCGKLDKNSIMSARRFADWIIKACQLHIDGEKLSSVARHGKANTFAVKYIPYDYSAEKAEETEEKALPDEKLVGEFVKRFAYEYTNQKAVDTPTKTSVSKLLALENDTEYRFTRRPAILSDKKMNAAEKGTATHKFMQYADFGRAISDPEGEIVRLTEWEFISENEANCLDRYAIAKFLGNDICKEMLGAGLLLKEQKFLVPLKDGEGETVIQGCVDCVYSRDDELCIVDFKTTRFDTDEEFVSAYRRQLEIYAYAMEEIFGIKVGAKYIYSLYLSKAIEVQ